MITACTAVRLAAGTRMLQRVPVRRAPRVALIDAHVDTSHPALVGAAIRLMPAASEPTHAATAHALAVASILAGRQPLMLGLCREASVSCYAVGDRSDMHDEPRLRTVLAALSDAVSRDVDIILIPMSLRAIATSSSERDALRAVVEQATRRGCVIVAATANDAARRESWSDIAPIVTVAALARGGAPMNSLALSGLARNRRLAAPGEDIPCATPSSAVALHSGSSFAAAIAAGVMLMLLARCPDATPLDVLQALVQQPPGTVARHAGATLLDAEAGWLTLSRTSWRDLR